MKKKKVVSAALAGVAATTILLAGTYAWHSISQQATNEARNVLNPGGRLHDDFTGMNATAAGDKLKRVYVENFTEENGGDRIFARIRLDEYLEIGVGAGTEDANKQVTVVGEQTAQLDDPSTWTPYTWTTGTSVFRDYVHINIGDKTTDDLKDAETNATPIGGQSQIYYLPTYNKDKDSAEAEINGTLGGPDKDKTTFTDAYQDFVAYGDGTDNTTTTETGIEIYAENEKALDEVDAAGMTAESITVSAFDSAARKFKGITADTTTTPGETIWKIKLMKADLDPANATEYTITDFAPAGATDPENFTAVYVNLDGDDEADIRLEIPAVDHTAKETLATAKLISMEKWLEIAGDNDENHGSYWVYDTDGWAYWADPIDPQTATGSLISGITVNQTSGKALGSKEYYYGLNVVSQAATAGDWGSDEAGTETGFYVGGITDNALKLLNTVSGMTNMAAAEENKAQAKTAIENATAGTATPVTIDGVNWYVLAKDDSTGKALLWTEDVLKDADTTVIKKNFADAKTYLTGEFLTGHKTVSAMVQTVQTDKVFLLSEADVFGSNTVETTEDYTNTSLLTNGTITAATTANESYWLRSADTATSSNAAIVDATASNAVASKAQTEEYALRPAVWVSYK